MYAGVFVGLNHARCVAWLTYVHVFCVLATLPAAGKCGSMTYDCFSRLTYIPVAGMADGTNCGRCHELWPLAFSYIKVGWQKNADEKCVGLLSGLVKHGRTTPLQLTLNG